MNRELESYLETALWSSVDLDGEPLDSKYCFDDIAQESIDRASKEVAEFMLKASPIIESCPHSEKFRPNIGHDFWLTRNHHGAGFWDGDYPKSQGIALTEIAHKFGECDIVPGDDGKLYFEGGSHV